MRIRNKSVLQIKPFGRSEINRFLHFIFLHFTRKSTTSLLVACFLFLTFGCNKSSPPDSAPPAAPAQNLGYGNIGTYPTSGLPIDNSNDNSSTYNDPTSGSTVPFYVVSNKVFGEYVGTHPLNAPTNIRINVDLTSLAGGRYGGTVHLMYEDAGQFYDGIFESGTDVNPKADGLKNNGELEAQYNYWFKMNSNVYFSGFFQDSYGAIVLVVDKTVGTADAQGNLTVSGNVWYKNFGQSYSGQSPYRKCWFISAGPYDCRSTTVINKTSPYPSGYTQLGAFKSLVKKKAFHQ